MSCLSLLSLLNKGRCLIRHGGAITTGVRLVRKLSAKPMLKLDTATPITSQLNDHFDTNENDFIYKHIHSRLVERFANLNADSVADWPIHSKIKQLENATSVELKDHLQVIRNKIKSLNQIELTKLLISTKDKNDLGHRIVRRMIDYELRWLLKEHVKTRLMDLDLWFYIADIFYESRMRSKFVEVLLNYLASEESVNMTNKQMLHLLFLIVLQRNQEGILEKYEARITKLIDRATLEDISIICMAYFKTKTKITDLALMRKIIDKTSDNLSSLDPKQPGYCSIVKSVRYSRNLECRENVLHMIMSLTDGLDRQLIFASPFNAVHTVKMMESFRIYDSKLVHLLRTSMFKNLDEFRIKDIQYSLTSLGAFAYNDLIVDTSLKKDFDTLCSQIVREVRPDYKYQYYHLFPILRALSMFGYYNDDLIAYTNRVIQDPVKLQHMSTVLEFKKSALLVYIATIIEGGKQKLINNQGFYRELAASIERIGNHGAVKSDNSLSHLNFILKSIEISNTRLVHSGSFRQIALALAESEQLKAPEFKFNFQFTLPHQNYSDLVISKNKREPGSFHPYSLLPAPVSPNDNHCLLYATHQSDFTDGISRLSGHKRQYNRLLQKLNYKVLMTDLQQPNIGHLATKIRHILDGC